MAAQNEAEKLDQEFEAGRDELKEALTQINDKVEAKVEAVESMFAPSLDIIRRHPRRSLAVALAVGAILGFTTAPR